MGISSEPSEWGVVHDLALIYLALAHGTDLEIAESERTAMREMLHAWAPGAEDGPLEHVIESVMLTYLGGHSREMLDTSIVSIKNSLDRKRRIAVLNDLADLASADGTIVASEASFIQQLAHFWEVEREIQN